MPPKRGIAADLRTAVLLCYVGGDRGVDLAYSAVPFILIIFMVQLACYFLGPLMTMRTRRKTGWQMPMSIQLTTEGVSVSHPSQSLVAYWPAIQDVVVKRKRLFLFTTPACAIIVPRRAFASDEQFDRWVGEAEALWAAARGHG